MTSKWPSVWVKISSSWICISLYVWTLVAPLVLTNRDFDWWDRRKEAPSKLCPSLWISACKPRASWFITVNSWCWCIPVWLILGFGLTVTRTIVIFICAACCKQSKQLARFAFLSTGKFTYTYRRKIRSYFWKTYDYDLCSLGLTGLSKHFVVSHLWSCRNPTRHFMKISCRMGIRVQHCSFSKHHC